MPTYTNGYIPSGLLVTFATGTNQDGYWEHQLSPGTLAKHRALVARASSRGSLRLTPGWSCYRPFYWQEVARRLYGNGAAKPGTSSHGGFWEGRQTLAMDYHNWSVVYGGDRAAWFADCRAVGLTPGMIMRSRGYPDEPWHVIDLDPWAAAPAGTASKPFEEDDMTPEQATQLAQIAAAVSHLKAVSDNTVRSGYGHVLDEGDLGTLLNEIRAVKGATHPTRNDYGRALDLGDLQTILNAVADVARPVAPDAAVTIEAAAKAVADELAKRLAS